MLEKMLLYVHITWNFFCIDHCRVVTAVVIRNLLFRNVAVLIQGTTYRRTMPHIATFKKVEWKNFHWKYYITVAIVVYLQRFASIIWTLVSMTPIMNVNAADHVCMSLILFLLQLLYNLSYKLQNVKIFLFFSESTFKPTITKTQIGNSAFLVSFLCATLLFLSALPLTKFSSDWIL